MILKDLNTAKEERLKGSEQFVNSCKLLLENNQDEERTLLKHLGLDMHIVEAEKNIELRVLNEKYEEDYKSKIFHISEIEKMCLKYRFFLRKTNQYRGAIPPDLGPVMNRFVKETKVAIGVDPHYNDFYIMAPPKMFKGYEPFLEKVKDLHDLNSDSVSSFFEALRDPIILYRIDNEHYAFIKKWGNDVTFWRTIPAWFMKTKKRVQNLFLVCMTFAVFLPIIIGNLLPKGTFETAKHELTLWAFVFGILTFVFLVYGCVTAHNFFKKGFSNGSTEKNWGKRENY